MKSLAWGVVLSFGLASIVKAQEIGGIRGGVYDKDFDVPLAAAQVTIAETGEKRMTDDDGHFVFDQVKPGTYTLVFTKDGYVRQVTANVVVIAGRMTDANASLAGEFTEMEEFVVQDLPLADTSELGLLNMRLEAPALMDSISRELMSQAGVSDAAGALRLVSGATVQEGKYAVVRGLPDRYVNSQLNGVRLPTADADKRAVQLDQFPAPLIDNIQVSKTFTPDQQGDASGGAVNIVTKGIPDATTFSFSSEIKYNSQVTGRNDFLTYSGGGVNFWGFDDGRRDIQYDNIGRNWTGAVGVEEGSAPIDYKWSLAAGGKRELDNGVKVGGFGTFFYERSSSFYNDGIDDKYWVEHPGDPLTPQYGGNGTPEMGTFRTELFDVTQGAVEGKWGGLATVGLETERHSLALLYMYTHAAQDKATLAENTRGKAYYFPGYNPNDPNDPGNQEPMASPYLRAQTLEYTERTTQTVQFSGRHKMGDPDWTKKLGDHATLLPPELDWGASFNSATLDQPDKRQFGSQWWGPSYDPGYPVYGIPPSTTPATYHPLLPAESYTLGNLQRIWKNISEDDQQYNLSVKFPFEQWSEDKGYLRLGAFYDTLDRTYKQSSFSNLNDASAQYEANWDQYWSAVFPSQDHPVTDGPPFVDVDYDGHQKISAWYTMADVPLWSAFKVVGGVRYETTRLSIVNHPEQDASWIPPSTGLDTKLNPGDADVSYAHDDALPSIGFEYTIVEPVKIRGSYSETVARQTFKELSPIEQQEYLGGDVFIGNPDLGMSSLKNYDLRADYTPYPGGLLSLSYFYKDISDPIEYVQRVAANVGVYTTPENYPKGRLDGVEIEVRQQMDHFSEQLKGLSLGANATFIHSEVTLPEEEAAKFSQPNIQAPMKTRDMTGAPEYLYNLFVTQDLADHGTRLGLFYTVRGDTLVTGAATANGAFVPDVYEKEYGTLNFTVAQKVGDKLTVKFQAKNLLDPKIEQVYRSKYVSGDKVKTSYRKGIDLTFSLSYAF
jgi:outer membrane receptor protein involved in Fe transport